MEVPINDLNDLLQCPLCNGYLIDATTLGECLHSFCRSCIIEYLQFWEPGFSKETCKINIKVWPTYPECPVCNRSLHESKPTSQLRSDSVLQALVYKLVPNLYIQEMNNRKLFYQNNDDDISYLSPEKRGEGRKGLYRNGPSIITECSDDEKQSVNQKKATSQWKHADLRRYHQHPAISLILEYFDCEQITKSCKSEKSKQQQQQPNHKRRKVDSPSKENDSPNLFKSNCPTAFQNIYLLVQPLATLSLLRQLILHKYTLLNGDFEPVFFFPSSDYTLSLDCTVQNLMDMSAYRRNTPMSLFFAIVPRSQLPARSLVERRELYLRQKLINQLKEEDSIKISDNESGQISLLSDSDNPNDSLESLSQVRKSQPLRKCRTRIDLAEVSSSTFKNTDLDEDDEDDNNNNNQEDDDETFSLQSDSLSSRLRRRSSSKPSNSRIS